MNKATRITLICIIAILMLAIIGGTIFAYVNKYAYAEYTDLTNNDIVNFNQLALNERITATYTGDTSQLTYANNYNTHTFYVRFTPENAPSGSVFYLEGSGYQSILFSFSGSSKIEQIVQVSFNITAPFKFWASSEFNYKNLMITDLTEMFGSNNLPSLSQCQELFTAEYYNWTSGTPMFFGRSQISNSYVLDYPATTGNLKPNGTSANTLKVDYVQDSSYGTSLALYSNNSNPEQYLDYYLWNLDTTFTAGSIITITATNYIIKGALSLVANNSMQQVLTSFENSNNSDTRRNLSYTFVVQEDFSSFWLVGEPLNASLTTPYAKFPFLQISVQYIDDIPSLIQGAKQLGIIEGESHYAYGTDGYNTIFNAGKQYALQHNTNNAWGSAWDFIESAFTGIGSLFTIEILPNVPLSVFILTPLMIILLFFIVKLVKGGG